MDISFRTATCADADGIARLHAASWQSAYRGIVPDVFLDADLVGERTAYWAQKMRGLSGREFVILVELGGELLGFCAVLDRPERGYDALIDNLHVRPDRKGHGIGRALMKAAAERLIASGRSSVYLWVLDGNTPAEGFYASRAGQPEDVSVTSYGGHPVRQTRYVWRTLDALTSSAAAR